MAFQNVNTNLPKSTTEPVRLTALKVGESVTGFVLRFIPSKQNPDVSNILMRAENSEDTFYVYSAGNVKYMVNDGKIKESLLTKIIRTEDKMVKGKKSSQFDVLQDPDQTIDDVGFAAITSVTEERTAAVKQATERASVKAKAAELANSMKR